MKRFGLAAVAVAIAIVWFEPQSVAQPRVWFATGFENPGPLNRYEFGYFYGESRGCAECTGSGRAPFWTFTHQPKGDHDGSGAAHLVRYAGADQFTMGWAVGSALNHSFRLGDHYYLRFRIRLDDEFRFEPATKGCFSSSGPAACAPHVQNKFVMMGTTGYPQSRMLVLLQRPMGNLGCTLGATDPNKGVGTSPRDFGLGSSDWQSRTLQYAYGSLSVHTNIGTREQGCVGPVPITYGNNPKPAVSPFGAPTRDGWHHVQIYVRSGGPGQAAYKIWDNNNKFDQPSYEARGFELGVAGWQNGFVIGGQTTGALASNAGYRIGAAEIGPDFAEGWYPLGQKRTP
jgi:hypothetical protein